jgi:hypothetical protein
MVLRGALLALGLVFVGSSAWAEAAPQDAAARRLAQLNADLLSHDSATAVLQAWCDAHGGAGVKVAARRLTGQEQPADEAVRTALKAGDGTPVRHRRVQLTCGARVLSDADNWYLPGRLTPEMNRLLDETETPFGAAVRSLGFRRATISAVTTMRPGQSPPPEHVLEHRAVLSTLDGAPFSLVVERYTAAVLAP